MMSPVRPSSNVCIATKITILHLPFTSIRLILKSQRKQVKEGGFNELFLPFYTMLEGNWVKVHDKLYQGTELPGCANK